MNLVYQVILIASSLFIIGACENKCIEGNGNIKSEYRVVSEFDAIENTTSFDVKISSDSSYSIRVEADENLLEYVTTTVRDGVLIIGRANEHDYCVRSSSGVYIEIYAPSLEKVELTGSGSIDANGYTCSELLVRNTGSGDIDVRSLITNNLSAIITGSGDIYIDGAASEAKYTLSGSGDINAFSLKSNNCKVASSGSGDVNCNAYYQLEIVLSGSGDVEYSGPATLEPVIHDSGSGSVYKRN